MYPQDVDDLAIAVADAGHKLREYSGPVVHWECSCHELQTPTQLLGNI